MIITGLIIIITGLIMIITGLIMIFTGLIMILTGLILIMTIHNLRNVQRQTETLRSLGRRYILDCHQLEQQEGCGFSQTCERK